MGNEHENDLPRRLEAILRKARHLAWKGWAEEDTYVVEAAIRELYAFPQILREGMRNAFEIGREHGKKEEELEKLEVEIAEETARLAREAWGRRG
jgi:hypothetical protein